MTQFHSPNEAAHTVTPHAWESALYAACSHVCGIAWFANSGLEWHVLAESCIKSPGPEALETVFILGGEEALAVFVRDRANELHPSPLPKLFISYGFGPR